MIITVFKIFYEKEQLVMIIKNLKKKISSGYTDLFKSLKNIITRNWII